MDSLKRIVYGRQSSRWLIAGLLHFLAGGFFFFQRWPLEPSGDELWYIASAENFLKNGIYQADPGRVITVAGRMPGWAIIYWPFRFFLSQTPALCGVFVIQLLFSIWAAVRLSRLTESLAGQKGGLISLLLFSSSGFAAYWHTRALTESLSTSTFVLCLSFLNPPRQRFSMLWAGLFFTWSVFLRYYFVIFIPILIWPLLRKRQFREITCVALPFVFFIGLWTIRNAFHLKKFVPLQYDTNAGYDVKASYLSIMRLISLGGGNNIGWYPGTEMRFFEGQLAFKMDSSQTPTRMPKRYLMTEKGFGQSFFDSLRQDFQHLIFGQPDSLTTLRLDGSILERSEKYQKVFKANHPFRAFILYPAWTGLRMIFEISPGNTQKIGPVKKIQIGLHYLVLVFGLTGLWFKKIPRTESTNFVFQARGTVIVLFVIWSWVVQRPENRYFLPGWAMVVAGCGFWFYRTTKRKDFVSPEEA